MGQSGHTHISDLGGMQFGDIKGNDQSTTQCGQCDYLPHSANLTVPWTCAYINVRRFSLSLSVSLVGFPMRISGASHQRRNDLRIIYQKMTTI